MGALSVVVLVAGCDRRDIRVYRVAKEPPPWVLPAGWQEQEAGGMSLANFTVTGKSGQGAEVSVVPFKGVVGQDADLVNIVRERFGLPPLSAEELGKQVERVEIGALPGKLFEMAAGAGGESNAPRRFIIATVARDGTSWFFRLSGEDALVREQKAPFVQFLKSFAFVEKPVSEPRSRRTAASARPPATSESTVQAPEWKVPAGWQEQPASSMRVGSFLVTGPGGKADVSVTMFPGDAGGLLANINRWRTQQMSLPAVQEADLEKVLSPLALPGGKAMLADMTADNKKTRMITAIVPREGNTWFFKMMGDEAVVGAEKAKLIQFVQSVK